MNKQKEIYNITFSINKKHLLLACVTLYSLLKNNTNHNFNIYLLHNSCLEEKEIKDICNKYPLKRFSNFKINLVDVSHLKELSSIKKAEFWTKEIYFKIFLPDLLPQVDKILHLDTDVLIRRDIKELLDTDITNNLFCGDSLKMDGYLNAGVLLYNLKLGRELNVCKEMAEYLHKHPGEQEEQTINSLYKDKILFFNINYVYTVGTTNDINIINKKDFNLIKAIHYTRTTKPWLLCRIGINIKQLRIDEYYTYLEDFIEEKFKFKFKLLKFYAFHFGMVVNSLERRIMHFCKKYLKINNLYTDSSLSKVIYKYSIIKNSKS